MVDELDKPLGGSDGDGTPSGPDTTAAEAKKIALLGHATGLTSGLPFNSSVHPAGRGSGYGAPNGSEYLSGVVAAQRGVGFDVRSSYQYNNRSLSEGATAWNDLVGMQVLDFFDPSKACILGIRFTPTGGSYAALANGDYDAKLVQIGQTIASKRPAGTGKVVLRPEWEFNYGTRASANLTVWNNAWRRYVTKVREGAGDRVKFSWSIAANTSSLSTLQAMYPGDAYVDVIGIDTYDAFVPTGRGYHDETTFLNQTGIGEVTAWARSIGKLVGFDEWGGHNNDPATNHSGGDNPDWPVVFYEWCRKNADLVAYECQFNDTATGNVMNNLWSTAGSPIQLPNQRAALIAKVQAMAGASPAPTALWSSDMTASTVPAAFDFNYVNSSYTSMGSLVSTSSPDGAGKVFRNTMSAASQGYRAHNELRLVESGNFPRTKAILDHYFRFTTMGSLMSNDDAKVGFGFVGAPNGADNNDMSYGGTKLASSWSERMTICQPGYLSSSDPGGLSAYLYAEYAGGQTRGDYGIRIPYRRNGQAVIPTQGQWYRRQVEVQVNTPGQNNGIYRVWIDGTLVVNLTDVRWNPSGQDIRVGYLMTQSFPNAALAQSAVFDQTGPTILPS